jgi:hypothetical protein
MNDTICSGHWQASGDYDQSCPEIERVGRLDIDDGYYSAAWVIHPETVGAFWAYDRNRLDVGIEPHWRLGSVRISGHRILKSGKLSESVTRSKVWRAARLAEAPRWLVDWAIDNAPTGADPDTLRNELEARRHYASGPS